MDRIALLEAENKRLTREKSTQEDDLRKCQKQLKIIRDITKEEYEKKLLEQQKLMNKQIEGALANLRDKQKLTILEKDRIISTQQQ